MLNDRIQIFKILIDDIGTINLDKYKTLLGDQYDKFVLYCNFIKNNDDILSVECVINTTEDIEFISILKSGVKEVFNT